ncbi:Putative ribonuclease P [Candidatus Phycorickettsia trachydisci]|uniref:Ribonuclease P protein component n=1 Tax=Candidatus Phycorickettsia trachydisci TaxID=2115978 RepID=A0A2P1P895_9RICK|nr:ribonuclease P protein component [Candidatus Phycorickettsia trachydisci]AVP87476.1 Putative ribonuclease P [Candidatus Phycorickettsia trachydisci]
MIKAINDNKVFQRINRLGYKVFNPNFLIIICDKATVFKYHPELQADDLCYYGIRISKKVGKAVVRNKIRRRLKSIIHQLDKTEELKSKAFMIVPRSKCFSCEFQALFKAVEKSFKGLK